MISSKFSAYFYFVPLLVLQKRRIGIVCDVGCVKARQLILNLRHAALPAVLNISKQQYICLYCVFYIIYYILMYFYVNFGSLVGNFLIIRFFVKFLKIFGTTFDI